MDQPEDGQPDSSIVSVFKTSDAAVLPLATMALEGEGIEYFIRHAGKSDSLQWMMSQDPTARPIDVEILVGSDVAEKARDLLRDLENPVPAATLPETASTETQPAQDPPIVTLEDAMDGTVIGTITESQLQELTSRLEEQGPHEYLLTGETVDMLQEANVDAGLIELLRQTAGVGGSGRAIRWVVR